MGWLRSVGSINLYVSFAEYRLFYRSLLHINSNENVLNVLFVQTTQIPTGHFLTNTTGINRTLSHEYNKQDTFSRIQTTHSCCLYKTNTNNTFVRKCPVYPKYVHIYTYIYIYMGDSKRAVECVVFSIREKVSSSSKIRTYISISIYIYIYMYG